MRRIKPELPSQADMAAALRALQTEIVVAGLGPLQAAQAARHLRPEPGPLRSRPAAVAVARDAGRPPTLRLESARDGPADHVSLRLRRRRRLRRHLPRRDRADRARHAGDRHHPRDRPPRRPPGRPRSSPTPLPYAPVGVHLAIVDPGVGGPRRAVAVRAADDGHLLVGPDNGLLPPAIDCFGGAAEAVDISASPFRLEPPSATFHGRDLFAPVAANLALGDELADAGVADRPVELLERQPVSDARLEQLRAFAHADRIDGFGNIALDLSRERPGRPPARPERGRVSVGSRTRRRTATRATVLRRGRRRRLPLLRGLVRDGWRSRSTAATPATCSRSASATSIELEPAP